MARTFDCFRFVVSDFCLSSFLTLLIPSFAVFLRLALHFSSSLPYPQLVLQVEGPARALRLKEEGL